MAIAKSNNPELVIQVTYDNRKAEQDFRNLARRLESLAESHQKKLDTIRSKTSGNNYTSEIAAYKQHLNQMEKLYAQSVAKRNAMNGRSLNDYKNYYNNLSGLSDTRIKTLTAELQHQQKIQPALRQYAQQLNNISQLSDKQIGSNTTGALLAGLVGGGVTASRIPGVKFSGLTNSLSLKDLKVQLGETYNYLSGEIKRNAGDPDQVRAIEMWKEHQQTIVNSVRTISQGQKNYNDELKRTNQQVKEHNDNLANGNDNLIGMVKWAGLIATATALWNVGGFVLDLSLASAKTEQLYKSFEKIGGNTQLLNKLRQATYGAVPDQQLLSTVNYGNFMGIDIQKMPELLQFASIRATETGQNIDYMVQSIVTGLGRKSPLILDNLGLKLRDLDAEVLKLAKSVNPAVKEVTDLEREFFLTEAATIVARKAIQDTGVDMENLSTKIGQTNTKWEKFKENIGTLAKPMTGYLADETDEALGRWNTKLENILGLLGMLEEKPKSFSDPNSWLVDNTAEDYKKAKEEAERLEQLKISQQEAQSKNNWWKQWLEGLEEQKETRDRIAKQMDFVKKQLEDPTVQKNNWWLKVYNDELERLKKQLKELNEIPKVDLKGIHSTGFDLGSGTSAEFKVSTGRINYAGIEQQERFNARIKAYEMSPVSTGARGSLESTLRNRDAIRQEIQDWQSLLPLYELNSEAITLINQKILELQESLANSDNNFSDFWNQWSEPIYEAIYLVETLNQATVDGIYNQMDVLSELINLENERWQKRSEDLSEAGLRDTAYYINLNKAHKKTVEAMEAREYMLKGSAWDAEKTGRISSIVMSTAQAIMQAWATSPFTAPIMTALIGATSAVQLNSVISQQNPYRRNAGGWIPGGGFTDDRFAILTGGEFVVNRSAARENASLLEAINAGASPSSGNQVHIHLTVEGNVVSDDRWVEDNLIPAINQAINKGFTISKYQK